MCDRCLYALALIFCTVSGFGQNQTIGPNGEGSFIAGPQGVPVRVLNEGNSWSEPLVVFKNSEIELIVPDIRTHGWAASYANAFKKEGNYFTYLYVYGVQSHRTMREALYVNTRTKIAIVVEGASAHVADFFAPKQTRADFRCFGKESAKKSPPGPAHCSLKAVSRPAETLRPLRGQPVAVLV
jgi:hypothetical protein